MIRNQEPEKRDGLDQLLAEWTVDASLPPRFQEGVWRRIRSAEEGVETGFWARLLAALPRPKIAVSYVVVVLLAGIVAGSMTAQFQARHLKQALSARYVHSIDPYLEPGSLP